MNISGGKLILEPAKALLPQGGGMDIKVDGDGDLWSCYAGGLLRGRAGIWHRFSRENGLLNDECLSLAIDRSGDIWYGAGEPDVIQHARSDKATIRHINRPDGSGFGTSYFVGTDSRNRIWRGTSNGVYVAAPGQGIGGQWLYLNKADGLPGVDTNQRSFVADADGSVWFGIDSSIVHIFPSSDFVHPTYAPSTFISGFSWNGGPFQMANQVARVPHGADLSAHFGSLQMDRRNALQFRYRLGPNQGSWTTVRDFDVRLGKLSWGNHRLEVQGRLGDGPWSKTNVESFEILRPVWLSAPGFVGFACASTLAIAGGSRWRKKRRKRAQASLPGLATWRSAALSSELQSFEGALLDGRFKMFQMVARGGFGTVWRASDRQHKGRLCAVKVFRRELLDNAWMTRRFQQEVAALERVNHPNVIRIYGHGTVNSGAPYLAMEFIEGETLREKLTGSRLANCEIAGYLRQIGAALAEIHSQGICHRDVKPENLMIRRDAAPGTELVLIDFSIAIVQDPDETIHGLSRAAGTLYYMAPEQAIGYAEASSDIYSLAKIVIEMLTGERLSTLLPNASIDLSARVRELLVDLRAGFSSNSVDLLASALQFDPSGRPNKAGAFGSALADDLERAI